MEYCAGLSRSCRRRGMGKNRRGTDTYQTITIIILGVIAVGILFWYLRFRKERNNKEDK